MRNYFLKWESDSHKNESVSVFLKRNLPPNTATLEQKLRLIPPQYLPLVECVVDACIKLK